MMRSLIFAILFATTSYADVAITSGNGNTTLYAKNGSFVTVSNCEQYADLGTTPAQARAVCAISPSTLHLDFFTEDFMKRDPSSYYDASKILAPHKLAALMKEIETIEEYRRRYGDAAVDMKHLAALHARVDASQVESLKMTEFKANQITILDNLKDEVTLTIGEPRSMMALYLAKVTIRFKYYAAQPCGLEGTLAARVLECYRYSHSSDLTLVTRDTERGSVWLSKTSRHFYYAGIAEIEPNYIFDITGELWRALTPAELRELPPALSRERVLISEKPTNLDQIRPYKSETVNKKTDEKIVFEFNEGLMTFTLVDSNGKTTLLKQMSVPVDPSKRVPVNGRDRWAYDQMYLSGAVADGYSDVWGGLVDVLDAGAYVFFPISLGVFAIYSSAFVLTLPLDGILLGGSAIMQAIPTRETRAQRNIKKMLLGKSVKSKNAVFRIMVNKIQGIKI